MVKNRGYIDNFYCINIFTPIKIRGVYKIILNFINLNYKNEEL